LTFAVAIHCVIFVRLTIWSANTTYEIWYHHRWRNRGGVWA